MDRNNWPERPAAGPGATLARPSCQKGPTRPDIDLLLRDALSPDGTCQSWPDRQPTPASLGGGSQAGPAGPVIPCGSATKGERSSVVGRALRVLPAVLAGLGLVVTPVATGDG